jgi:hypothetical protein
MSGVMCAMGGGGVPGVINSAIPNGIEVTEAIFVLDTDGTYGMAGTAPGVWVTPANSTVAAQWQVKLDVTAGGLASGTTGTWLDIGASSIWTCYDGVAVTATFTLSFREKASTTVRSVQTGIVLNATSP